MSDKSSNKQKMNFLYKISFIISLLCIPLLVLSLVFAYLLDNKILSVIFSASGALLAFIGIILGMYSKPKKNKPKKRRRKKKEEAQIFADNQEEAIDNTAR